MLTFLTAQLFTNPVVSFNADFIRDLSIAGLSLIIMFSILRQGIRGMTNRDKQDSLERKQYIDLMTLQVGALDRLTAAINLQTETNRDRDQAMLEEVQRGNERLAEQIKQIAEVQKDTVAAIEQLQQQVAIWVDKQ